MHYCTLADLQLAVPMNTLVQLSNDVVTDYSAAAPELDQAVIDEAVRQAEELVDAYLRGRYVLPLETVPTVVKDIAVNLARHWLYARRPEGADLPDAVTRTYKSSLSLLEAIRDGKITLGLPSGSATPEPGEIRVRASRRRFAGDVWENYG